MNREACQKFDERLNEVMDLRLDPNEDAELKSHALLCDSCYDLLDSFSELHTGLSGPNRIPVALLKQETNNRSSDIQAAWINLIIVGALATMLLVGFNLGLPETESHITPVAMNPAVADATSFAGSTQLAVSKPFIVPKVPTEALPLLSETIRSNNLYSMAGDFPGFLPVRVAMDCCVDWIEDALFAIFDTGD